MNGIGFKNIKVFKDSHWFDFRPITVLTGTNNSGKSSVINTMQLLQENLTAKNLDQLLNTEFILKKNQNKYGSIATFVNKNSAEDIIQFERVINNFKYEVSVKILEGLQYKGIVNSVNIYCNKTKERIFTIDIKQPYPDIECSININYRFFLEDFYKKCENTLNYYDRIEKIQEKVDRLNNGETNLKNEIEDDKIKIEADYKLKIRIGENYQWDPNSEKLQPKGMLELDVHFDDAWKNGDLYLSLSESLDQILFTDLEEINMHQSTEPELSHSKIFPLKFSRSGISPLDKTVFNDIFLTSYKKGILNISKLFDDDINSLDFIHFKNEISNFYNKSFEQAYKLFCDDWVTLTSCFVWEPHVFIDDEEIDRKDNLPFRFINGLADFGTITSLDVKDFDGNAYHPLFGRTGLFAKKIKEFRKTLNSHELVDKGFLNFFDSIIPSILLTRDRDKIVDQNVFKYIKKHINEVIFNCNLSIRNIYISSSRSTTKRFYNFNDDADLTNLLEQIENRMTIEDRKIAYEFVNKWLKEFDIADELIFEPDIDTGNFKTYLKRNDAIISLADFGLGTNQLLPILLSITLARFTFNKTVVIEEPEANLHPAMQSKLADLFVDAYTIYKVQIMLETHSEYLIRKLQYLVGSQKSELKPQDVIIYYFYKPDHPAVLRKEVKQVEKIEIDEWGRLTKEFGTGFFDEADKIAFDIFSLKQSQSN